jgi:hypothetical protein
VASRTPDVPRGTERLSRAEAARLLGDDAPRPIERLAWDDFAADVLHRREGEDGEDIGWKAGEHASVFAPTDGGKTYLIRHGLLPLWQRYPVLWLKFKPNDGTLDGMGNRVKEYPSWDRRFKYRHRKADSADWDKDPEWFVVELPTYEWRAGRHESEGVRRARALAGHCLDRAYREGGWVIVIDEVRAFSDVEPPALQLRALLENNWQRGRSQPLTVIAATQQPANAPSSMYDQPRWVFLGRTLDAGRHERIGEIGGDTDSIEAALPTLRHQEFIAVDRREGDMWIVKVGE